MKLRLSTDNVIRRWNLPSGQAEPTGEGFSFFLRVARSSDGKTIAAASCPGRLEFWDTAGKRLRAFSLPARSCLHMRFAPDGKLLALGGSDGKLRLWDVAKGHACREWKPLARPGGNGYGSFLGLAWSPDGRFVAASVLDVGLRVWETASGKEMWQSPQQSAIAFSADGKTLVSENSDHSLTFHDAATGKVRFTVMDRKKFYDGLFDIAFSRDGGCLATSHNGFISLRDPKTGKCERPWRNKDSSGLFPCLWTVNGWYRAARME